MSTRKNLETVEKRKTVEPKGYTDAYDNALLTDREAARRLRCRVEFVALQMLRYNFLPVVSGKIRLWREMDVNISFNLTWENSLRKIAEVQNADLEQKIKDLKADLKAAKRKGRK